MSITNDCRDYRRERLHLPLQVLWQEEQSKQSSAWMLDASPTGLLLELSSMTNLSDDNLVRVAFQTLRDQDDWLLVEHESGRKGWLSKDLVWGLCPKSFVWKSLNNFPWQRLAS